jgi:4-hydroxy 2-oxovalerate aldolase
MQIHKIDHNKLKIFLNILRKLNISLFYFADSFGALRPRDIKRICDIIKKNWKRDFGIHAHDNSGYALANTIEAMNNGAKYLDCTILGMGRGAGNVCTESLITELNDQRIGKYIAEPVYSLASDFFRKYKKKYNWGSSIYYHLAAVKNIHPSYIQELLFDDRYNPQEMIQIIFNLSKNKNAHSYNPYAINKIKNVKITNIKKNWCINRNVLIIGQGQSVKKNKKKILKFIIEKKCLVLSLNINKFLQPRLIDYCVVSDEKRFALDQHQYKKQKKIISPADNMEKLMNKNNKNFLNYGITVDKNTLEINDKYCVLPNRLVIGYALALSKYGKAKNIYLEGFDGYENNEELNFKMKNYLKFLEKKIKYKLRFTSISLYQK